MLGSTAVTIQPDLRLQDAVSTLVMRMRSETCRAQEGYDASGPWEFPGPWTQALHEVDAAIGLLKRTRKDFQEVAHHVHDWNDDDYCSVCGADGRA